MTQTHTARPLFREALGATLRRRRVAQKRTLRDVSGAAMVSLGYLSEVERGHKELSSEMLYAISDALGASVGDVIAEVGLDLQARELRTVIPAPAHFAAVS